MSSTTDARRDRGQVLAIFALSLVTIVIVAALAFDTGMMLLEKRDQQNAADAAALARRAPWSAHQRRTRRRRRG